MSAPSTPKGYELSDTALRCIQNELDSGITFADSRWQTYCRGLLHDAWMARRRLDAIWQACIGANDNEHWREKFRELDELQARTTKSIEGLTADLEAERQKPRQISDEMPDARRIS